ncbi:hypothetical protein EVAR_94247_1 [Eumeta japonica]|uniref:Uncharacterized protein n=1 Tax=Eumeta variegata TaxID=151549 RepID=A0A4C1UN27_EUMVA|nr:hypothetical protein EVAR_94247_1 [Eumeta japonica]
MRIRSVVVSSGLHDEKKVEKVVRIGRTVKRPRLVAPPLRLLPQHGQGCIMACRLRPVRAYREGLGYYRSSRAGGDIHSRSSNGDLFFCWRGIRYIEIFDK